MVTAGRRLGGATPRVHNMNREDEETPEQDEGRKRAVERLQDEGDLRPDHGHRLDWDARRDGVCAPQRRGRRGAGRRVGSTRLPAGRPVTASRDFGTGQVIASAVEAGCSRVVLGAAARAPRSTAEPGSSGHSVPAPLPVARPWSSRSRRRGCRPRWRRRARKRSALRKPPIAR